MSSEGKKIIAELNTVKAWFEHLFAHTGIPHPNEVPNLARVASSSEHPTIDSSQIPDQSDVPLDATHSDAAVTGPLPPSEPSAPAASDSPSQSVSGTA